MEVYKQLVVADYGRNERYVCSLIFSEEEIKNNDIMDLVAMEHFKRNPDDNMLAGEYRQGILDNLEIVGVVDVHVKDFNEN